MRRLWIWMAFSAVGVVVCLLVGVWLAARWWPQQVGPYLPLRLAMGMAHWGEGERRAAVASFASAADTPAGLAECSHVLATMLRADAVSRGFALDFLVGNDPSLFMTGECADIIFALTEDPDAEVRSTARYLWAPWGKTVRALAALTHGVLPHPAKPAAPDDWVPDRCALPGLLFYALLGNGYDHKTPNKYRKISQDLLATLLAAAQETGRWSTDPASQAVVLMALAEAYAMTNDPDLRPMMERGLHRLDDPPALRSLWMRDTTTAFLVTNCINTMAAAASGPQLAMAIEHRRLLREGYESWAATGTTTIPPGWLSDGREIEAPAGERWGALLAGGALLGNDRTAWPAAPPPALTQMETWSPLGGYLAALACYHGHVGGRFTPSSWRNALIHRWELADRRRRFTRDRDGTNGSYAAHPPFGDEWEAMFVMLQGGLRY